jgi:uncharacterized protein YndB with AHSA1/START domain
MTVTQINTASFGVFTAPSTLTLERTLPGPIERVWSYIIDSDLRQQWLAAGVLNPQPGASFELVWRNDELSASASERPAGFSEVARATCTVVEVEPMRRLSFLWPGVGEVTFDLEPVGEDVLLTVTHRQLADRQMVLMVGAGWHMHCDILVARMNGHTPDSFWSGWVRLRKEYDRRLAV